LDVFSGFVLSVSVGAVVTEYVNHLTLRSRIYWHLSGFARDNKLGIFSKPEPSTIYTTPEPEEKGWWEQEPYISQNKPKPDNEPKADDSFFEFNFPWPRSGTLFQIIELHHDLMFFLIVIVVFVSWMIARKIAFFTVENSSTPRVAFAHHTLLEKI
jgi:hypothetical protein